LKIVILDFGSQYTQLIARRIREIGVYAEIEPYYKKIEGPDKKDIAGIILSGSPASIYDSDTPKIGDEIFSLGVPILGICYGMQIITDKFSGKITPTNNREYGPAQIIVDKDDELIGRDMQQARVWMSHGDVIKKLPDSFEAVAHTQNSPYAVIRNRSKNIWAIQFHPEVVHTQKGTQILENFTRKICNITDIWNMENFIDRSFLSIKQKVGNSKVICAVSGGVDSTVVALLVNKAIGDNLIPVFVNNGLLRLNEAEHVIDSFKKLNIKLQYVDASDDFLNALKNVTDPEQKRKIIGHVFIDVFENIAKEFKDAKFLAQGTLYPDVIESVSVKGPSAIIKSHHNVGGLPEKLNFKLIEPLRELFKDEVRLLGEKLGLSEEFINRQPFPGPGLAIRIIGNITKEKLGILQKADSIVLQEVKKYGIYNDIWQSFAVLLPINSVGVMGDKRTYENVVALRAVESADGMTADWAHLPYDLLKTISSMIINEVNGVNRVVFDISSKPPSTIEWE